MATLEYLYEVLAWKKKGYEYYKKNIPGQFQYISNNSNYNTIGFLNTEKLKIPEHITTKQYYEPVYQTDLLPNAFEVYSQMVCLPSYYGCPYKKIVEDIELIDAYDLFKSIKAKGKTFSESENFTIQVSVEDCTGCSLCVEVCPGKNKTDPELKAINMTPKLPLLEEGIENWDYFLELPEYDRSKLDHTKVKESQFLQPLFEFSGACAACGE